MKYRHKVSGEIIEVTESTTEGQRPVGRGVMWLGVGDLLVQRASGEYEGYQPTHPFWADYEEVVETRVVSVSDGKATRYHAEKLTPAGWIRGDAKTTQAEAEADVPVKPTVVVLKEFEGGQVKAQLVVGDDPETPAVETTFWQKVKAFVGLGG